MNAEDLTLFQFGPVQDFIAQAETLGELQAGSALLSALALAALGALPAGSRRVFPVEGVTEGVPNRFLAFVPAGQGAAAMRAAEAAFREALEALAREALAAHPEWSHGGDFVAQVRAWPQLSWAVLRADEASGSMGDDYAAIGRRLAARRNTRAFDAWPEEATGRAKDILSGKEAALDGALGFGAMNLIKHRRAEALEPALKAALETFDRQYVAVLAMDGDQMGARLSGFKTVGEHRAFSQALLGFAEPARERVRAAGGVPIYVGGDDVLAVLPVELAVACAEGLAALFAEKVAGCHASAGIAVGHASVPRQELVHRAHAAEALAKQRYGRNALALAIYKRTGEIQEWGCKWGSQGLRLLKTLVALPKAREKDAKSLGRFPYKLAGLLRPYGLKGALGDERMRDVVLAETRHAIAQTPGMAGALDAAALAGFLEECAVPREDRPAAHAEDYLGLFLCAAFLSRQDGTEEGEARHDA